MESNGVHVTNRAMLAGLTLLFSLTGVAACDGGGREEESNDAGASDAGGVGRGRWRDDPALSAITDS